MDRAAVPNQTPGTLISDKSSDFTRSDRPNPEFDRANFSLPRRTATFNDDVRIEAYLPAHLTNAGRRRKGIHELLDDCRSFGEHIRRAIRETFPFSTATPLPAETVASAHFARDMPADKLVRFWGAQLSPLEQLVSNCSLDQQKWGEAISPNFFLLRASSVQFPSNS